MSSDKTYKAKMDRLYRVDEELAARRPAKEKQNAPTVQKATVDLSQWERGWENYLADEQAAKAEKAKTPWWLQALTRSFSTANENPINVAMNNVVYDYRHDDSYKKPTDQWSEEQKQRFGTYYLSDPKTAYDYAAAVNDGIDQAAKNKQIQAVEKAATSDFWSGAKHTLGAVLTAPLTLADYLDNVAEFSARGRITQKPTVTPLEYVDTVTGSIANELNEYSGTFDENIPLIGGKGLGDVYGIGFDALQRRLLAATGTSALALISYFGQNAARGIADGSRTRYGCVRRFFPSLLRSFLQGASLAANSRCTDQKKSAAATLRPDKELFLCYGEADERRNTGVFRGRRQ